MTLGVGGEIVGYVQNVREENGAVLGDVILDDKKPLSPEWLAIPKTITIRG